MSIKIQLFIVILTIIGPILAAEVPEWCKKLPRPVYKNLKRVDVAGEKWFEIYEVHPGVFALYGPRQYEEVISYLIVGNKQALLLDTGMGITSIRKVVSALTSLPVIVLNSHTHPDHIGGNYEFNNIFGVDTGYTKNNARGYHDPEMKAWVKPPNICGDLPSGFKPDAYQIPAFHIQRSVKDQQVIDLGNRKLEILLTPGHTPDALCLLDAENKLLFTGDTFYLGPIYLFAAETDFEEYQKSVDRLAKLSDRLELLLPSHNIPVASPVYLKKLQDAVNAVKKGTVKGVRTKDGLQEYTFDGFSVLLRGS
jgi:glyoxylase-like metal-dependent hydrolase (beta-lactamase superfamily II)